MDMITKYLIRNNPNVVAEVLGEILLHKGLMREFIFVDESMRGIGKTTALINFAKRFGHGVIVPSYMNTKLFADEHGYTQIYNESSNLRGRDMFFVTDEGTNTEYLRQELGLNLLTGFVNKSLT